jgi:hypothetical protein
MLKFSLAISLTFLLLVQPSVADAQRNKAKPNRKPNPVASSIPPQAVPIYNLLKAAEMSDVALFKSSWSADTLNMWDAWGVTDYKTYLLEYRRYWREELGTYRLKDLRFVFTGDDSSGVVDILNKGEKRSGLFVVRENGVWKATSAD